MNMAIRHRESKGMSRCSTPDKACETATLARHYSMRPTKVPRLRLSVHTPSQRCRSTALVGCSLAEGVFCEITADIGRHALSMHALLLKNAHTATPSERAR